MSEKKLFPGVTKVKNQYEVAGDFSLDKQEIESWERSIDENIKKHIGEKRYMREKALSYIGKASGFVGIPAAYIAFAVLVDYLSGSASNYDVLVPMATVMGAVPYAAFLVASDDLPRSETTIVGMLYWKRSRCVISQAVNRITFGHPDYKIVRSMSKADRAYFDMLVNEQQYSTYRVGKKHEKFATAVIEGRLEAEDSDKIKDAKRVLDVFEEASLPTNLLVKCKSLAAVTH